MAFRVFHAVGPCAIIRAHECRVRHEECPGTVCRTFSGQFEDFCDQIGAEGYIVSCQPEKAILRDGSLTLEQRPKPWPDARGRGST